MLTFLQRVQLNNELQNYDRKLQLQEITIDGNKISGYAKYTYFDAKSYVKTPDRSIDGKMSNLNSIATFLTPRLTISFSMMDIDTYRVIMKLIKSKNEFTVTCYDIVEDELVTKKMYFQPEDYPELFMYDLYLLGVINYTIELTGTNNDLDLVSVTYHLNPPASTGQSDQTIGIDDIAKGTEILIGDECNYQEETFSGNWKFVNWVDSNGFVYLDNQASIINSDLVLYAQWQGSGEFTLSYNYGVGETYIDYLDENKPLYSKTIQGGQAIGTLPTTSAKSVTYDGQQYTPYTFDGWYKTPVKGEGSEPLTSASIYDVTGNSTIYQLFTPNEYTISFNSNGGNYTPHDITQGYGSAIYAPNAPTKSGYTFGGWYSDEELTKSFSFSTMPPKDIILYAKWQVNNA